MIKNQKQIVIVESFPTEMLAKIAIVLKRKNYKTALIHLSGYSETKFYQGAYDKRINFNSRFIKVNTKNLPKVIFYIIKKSSTIFKNFILIRRLEPYVVIGRANPNWLCFLFKHVFKKYPFVYFPYDIRSFCYESLEEAMKDGVPRFEIDAERHCYENSDGIMHKGGHNELTYLYQKVFGRKVQVMAPILHFLP